MMEINYCLTFHFLYQNSYNMLSNNSQNSDYSYSEDKIKWQLPLKIESWMSKNLSHDNFFYGSVKLNSVVLCAYF